ncbi:MAG: type II toxin-antitoxin system HigB family toxin [Terriglobales bacterium]
MAHTSHFAKCRSNLHIISKSAWRSVLTADPSLARPIADWHKVATHAAWRSLADVRKVYPHADYVEPYTVFNIKGGAYRLIVKIEYRWQLIFVKHLLTHAAYDRGGWKK